MEKQQELQEIHRYLWEEVEGYDLTWEPDCNKLAEKLYEDGWRKQQEAQWIPIDDFHDEMYACSNCQLHVHKDLLEHFRFCSKCGAKIVEGR